MNIFARRNEDRVEVPEIEVNGNEATVQTNDDLREQDRKVRLSTNDDAGEQDRNVRLPKTKWF